MTARPNSFLATYEPAEDAPDHLANKAAELEELAGEFEEIEALLDENRHAAAEQFAHRAANRLRERAEELRKGQG